MALLTTTLGAIGMIVLGGMVSSYCKPLFNLLSQQLFRVLPNELIPPVNIISMRYKGLIDEEHYYAECKLNGISKERAILLYDEAAQRLGAYDAINLWRRGGKGGFPKRRDSYQGQRKCLFYPGDSGLHG